MPLPLGGELIRRVFGSHGDTPIGLIPHLVEVEIDHPGLLEQVLEVKVDE